MSKMTLDEKIAKAQEVIAKEEAVIAASREKIKKAQDDLKKYQKEKNNEFASEIIQITGNVDALTAEQKAQIFEMLKTFAPQKKEQDSISVESDASAVPPEIVQ